jgi:hypothetical protein
MSKWVGWITLLMVLVSAWLWGQETGQTSGPWVVERSGTTAALRGIHAVGGGVAWASGTNGTVLRTEDGGYEWQSCAAPPDSAKLDFRGIWAWDDQTAIVMASGTGDASRLYKTTEGCSHWTLLFTNPDKDGFWDALQMTGDKTGLIIGDPVPGRRYFWKFSIRQYPSYFPILGTWDRGTTWRPLDTRSVWAAMSKDHVAAESIFAASNSSLLELHSPFAWLFVTGGDKNFLHIVQSLGATPMICKKSCYLSRETAPTLASGPTAGGFSIGANLAESGIPVVVAVGGDYKLPDSSAGSAATCVGSMDGIFLKYRCEAATRPPHGYRSAVAWDAAAKAWIAAGTNGSDISYDDGKTWESLDNGNWNALSLPWVVGPNGRIAKLDAGKLPHPSKN